MTKLKIIERSLHPLCEDCINYQTPKGHGSMLASNRYSLTWEEDEVTPKKTKFKKNPKKIRVQVQRMILKKDKYGKRYPHPFSSLIPACTGLDIKFLEKNNYPYIDKPPCFVDKDHVKPR